MMYSTPKSLLSIRSRNASQPPIFSPTSRSAFLASSISRRSSSVRVPSASNSALTPVYPYSSLPFLRSPNICCSVLFIKNHSGGLRYSLYKGISIFSRNSSRGKNGAISSSGELTMLPSGSCRDDSFGEND